MGQLFYYITVPFGYLMKFCCFISPGNNYLVALIFFTIIGFFVTDKDIKVLHSTVTMLIVGHIYLFIHLLLLSVIIFHVVLDDYSLVEGVDSLSVEVEEMWL